MLTFVDVSAAISARRDELERKVRFTTEQALRSLAAAVMFDPRKLVNLDGSFKRVQDLDDDTVLALERIEVLELLAPGKSTQARRAIAQGTAALDVRTLSRKVTWCDRNKAREQAMRYFGLFKRHNAPRGDAAIRALLAAIAENGADKFDVKP
jgi:phage terminase small subunit